METWASLQKNYLPVEYQSIWSYINKHVEDHNALPSFEAVQLSGRDESLRNKFLALEKVEDLDIPASTLLEYLKNEYAQIEIMNHFEKFLTESIAIESAKDNIEYLQDIVLDLEEKIDLKDPQEDMRRMSLFSPIEDLERQAPLGLNDDFDRIQTFGPKQYIAFGGKRGQGKSFTCANLAVNTYESGASVIYFTIEMSSREIMQRCCSISTGVPANAIENRNLSLDEWRRVAEWWSERYEDGEKVFQNYLQNRNFDDFHSTLTKNPLRERQIDIVHSSSLSLSNIRMELDKKVSRLQPKMVIVDYVNQVKRSNNFNPRMGQYDWTEQIEVSKALKEYAQDYNVLMVTAYQIDATGEARFAKGVLDSLDAAYTIDNHNKENNIISFNCVKNRSSNEVSFTSGMDWSSLKIGPHSGQIPSEDDLGEEQSIA